MRRLSMIRANAIKEEGGGVTSGPHHRRVVANAGVCGALALLNAPSEVLVSQEKNTTPPPCFVPWRKIVQGLCEITHMTELVIQYYRYCVQLHPYAQCCGAGAGRNWTF